MQCTDQPASCCCSPHDVNASPQSSAAFRSLSLSVRLSSTVSQPQHLISVALHSPVQLTQSYQVEPQRNMPEQHFEQTRPIIHAALLGHAIYICSSSSVRWDFHFEPAGMGSLPCRYGTLFSRREFSCPFLTQDIDTAGHGEGLHRNALTTRRQTQSTAVYRRGISGQRCQNDVVTFETQVHCLAAVHGLLGWYWRALLPTCSALQK